VIVSVPRNAGLIYLQVLCGKAPSWDATNEGAVTDAIVKGDR
jgi:hypothetical protein